MRRRNKSNKVPGVKLRPAQPQASTSKRRSSSPDHETLWAEETQLDSEDTGYLASCPRPLTGIVVCATGIQDKPTLFRQAVELGAEITMAFTDRVTHLLALTHGGAKYKCALEHRVPIMHPDWITDNYEIWLRGDDVDVPHSVEQHRLPVFAGVVLSLSGTIDIETQAHICHKLRQHKGVFAEDIVRPVKVTHLLCSGDDETDKMKSAQKFNQRKEANIQLIWEEWFWDSLAFGGRFDETTYHVQGPRPERRSQTGSQTNEPPASSPPSTPAPKAPAPAREDEDDDEMASKKRVPDVTLKLWETVLKPRGYGMSEGKLLRSPSKKGSQPLVPSPERPRSPVGDSVINKFRRGNSFAPAKEKTMGQPFASTARSASAPVPPAAASTRLFAGVKFCALGEAKSVNVRSAIEQAGGVMVSEEEEATYIIVRLVSGSKLYRREKDPHLRAKFRTECWLEQSIFEEKICAVDAHISFVPLAVELPIPGAENVQLSLSGLDEADGCFTRRLVRALGMSLAQQFSKKATHLLCPAGTGAKFDKAREWRIPVVNRRWLADMAREGRMPDLKAKDKAKDSGVVGVGVGVGCYLVDPPDASAQFDLDLDGVDGTAMFHKALEACPQSVMRPPPGSAPAKAGPGPSTTAFKLNGLLPSSSGNGVLPPSNGNGVLPPSKPPSKPVDKGKGKATTTAITTNEDATMMDITNDLDLEGQTTFARALDERPQSTFPRARSESTFPPPPPPFMEVDVEPEVEGEGKGKGKGRSTSQLGSERSVFQLEKERSTSQLTTEEDKERERERERNEVVPSSRTPSPMKMPSPLKMPPLLDMPALGLGLGLGSGLKRRSEDSVEREREREKRPRPRPKAKAKASSRPESRGDVAEPPPPVTVRVDGFDDTCEDGNEEGESGGGGGGGGGVGGEGAESMRVTYDDNEDRKRLMSMVSGGAGGKKGKGAVAVAGSRKSTRKSAGRV